MATATKSRRRAPRPVVRAMYPPLQPRAKKMPDVLEVWKAVVNWKDEAVFFRRADARDWVKRYNARTKGHRAMVMGHIYWEPCFGMRTNRKVGAA